VLDTDRRVVALAIARASDAFANSFLIVVLPLYLASGVIEGQLLGLGGAAAIGLVLGLVGFVHSSLQPLVGRASDALGRRQVFVLAGLGLLAVANLAYAWTSTFPEVLAVRVLQGMALALAIPTTIALVSEFSTVGTRGESMGLYNSFRLAGYGVGPIVAGTVVHAGPYTIPGPVGALTGYQAAFACAAASALAGLLVVGLLVRDPARLEASTDGIELPRVTGSGNRWLDPVFALAVCTFFAAISISLIASIENEINARLGQTAIWFGIQFSAFLIPHVLLQTPIGRWSDRAGRLPFVAAGLALAVPATLAQGFVTEPWHLLAARLGQGFATALFFSPGLALAGDLARETATGADMSLLTTAFGLGVATGPIAAGFLVGFGFAVPFAVGATLCALATGLVLTQIPETVVAETRSGSAVAESA
jgi:MFS family permease